jgi:hypothetical protein
MLKNLVFLGQIFIKLKNRCYIAATGPEEYDKDKGIEHNMNQASANSTSKKEPEPLKY